MLIKGQNILILDSRKELSIKYKRLLENKLSVFVAVEDSEQGLFDYIKSYEPDLILVSDSISSLTSDICKNIRRNFKEYRPIVIAMSKSSHLDDKLENLKSGCDDFISEPIDNEEFVARIEAHLRRTYEENANLLTGLSTYKNVSRVLKRVLSFGLPWSAILVDVDYFQQYKQIYGQLASEKLIQAYTAIIRSTIDDEDFLGHLDSDNFIIVTVPEKSYKIARTLEYAFDKIAPRFYTQEDSDKGYITLFSDETAGRRVPIVSTSIGIVDNNCRRYDDYKDILNVLFASHKLAKSQAGSSVIKDAPQICGINSVENLNKNKVLIVEKDAALAYLISSTLEMQGRKTQAISNYDDVEKTLEEFVPDVVIMDAGDSQTQQGVEVCSRIKNHALKIIMSTILHNKETILDAGADLYLPKPYDIVTLHNWVKRFLDE